MRSYPYVTGTSVLAVKYADGVMMASDTLGAQIERRCASDDTSRGSHPRRPGAYGATKRYKSVERMRPVGGNALIGASGEVSDFAYILTLLDELATSDVCADDGHAMQPAELYAYLTRVMYNRRNKLDPLWNSLVVAGVGRDGSSFLGMVNMIGTHYTDAHVATGFGAQLARPLFREKHREDMTAAEARALLEEALRVCYYRDKNSINKFQIATVTKDGASVSAPFALYTEWSLKAYENPSGVVVGTW